MENRQRKHGEYYTVKRWRLLQYLMKLGFKPLETLPDPTNPHYCWWKFKNSAEFEDAIEAYFENMYANK